MEDGGGRSAESEDFHVLRAKAPSVSKLPPLHLRSVSEEGLRDPSVVRAGEALGQVSRAQASCKAAGLALELPMPSEPAPYGEWEDMSANDGGKSPDIRKRYLCWRSRNLSSVSKAKSGSQRQGCKFGGVMSFAAAAISAKNHGRKQQEKEKAQATRARGMTGKQKNLCKSEDQDRHPFPVWTVLYPRTPRSASQKKKRSRKTA